MTGEERLPEGEDDEISAKLFLGGLAELADALLRDAELGGDVVERGVVEVVATEDVRVARGQARERGAHGGVRVAGLGGAGRARGGDIDEGAELFAVGVGFVERAGVRGGGELVEARDGVAGEAGERGDLGEGRRAAEIAFKRSLRAAHECNLGAGVAGERIEAAEFVEHGAAHAHVAIRARLLGRTVPAQQRLDEREFAGACEVVARDVRREAAIKRAEHGIDDIEGVGERGRAGDGSGFVRESHLAWA